MEALKVVFCVQNADHLFFKELMGIFRNMHRAIASQHAGDLERPADLYFGTFNGIEVRFFDVNIKSSTLELISSKCFWYLWVSTD